MNDAGKNKEEIAVQTGRYKLLFSRKTISYKHDGLYKACIRRYVLQSVYTLYIRTQKSSQKILGENRREKNGFKILILFPPQK